MCFVAGSSEKPMLGSQVEEIAARMKESADRITAIAIGKESVS